MTEKYPIRIIDSHIHLFAQSDLNKLSWMTDGHILASNHTIREYKSANIEKIDRNFKFSGFIFIESDVKANPTDEYEWTGPIDEVKFVISQKRSSDEANYVRGLIPWAPIFQGEKGLERFYEELKKEIGETNLNHIKGFRYLIQDKPDRTMLSERFIEGLNWLGSKRYVFDLGIDLHRRGFLQFEEFEHLLKNTDNVTYIMNHLGKPDFQPQEKNIEENEFFNGWKKHLNKVAQICRERGNTVYIKLSGVFSEIEQQSSLEDDAIATIVLPWIKFLVKNWDNLYLIWGSDWPVCTINGGDSAFHRWLKIVNLVFDELNLARSIRENFFYNNTIKAYNLQMEEIEIEIENHKTLVSDPI